MTQPAVQEKIIEFEFTEESVLVNGMDSLEKFSKGEIGRCQINEVPKYLIGKVFKVIPLNPHNYDIGKEIRPSEYLATEKNTKEKFIFYKFSIRSYSKFIFSLIFDCPEIKKYDSLIDGSELQIDNYPLCVSKYYEPIKPQKIISEYLRTKGKKNEQMNPTIRSKMIYGIAAIMKFVHEKGFIHQNLCMDNIELDEKLEPRIINFDFLCPFFDGYEFYRFDKFCSPEFFSNYIEYCSFPMDVYSYGMLLYAMFSDQFIGLSQKLNFNFYNQIVNGEKPKRAPNIPDNYWELINECWKLDPNERPPFSDIVEILKNDEFALEEFGMKTDLDALHEYQSRIDKIGQNLQKEEQHQTFIGSEDQKFIKMIEKIGSGATSDVYKVVDSRTNQIMAKKILKTGETITFKDLQNAIKEFEFLRAFNHPCICKAIAINTAEEVDSSNPENTTVSLYLEYFQYSLKNLLNSNIMNNTLKTRIVVEIGFALSFIHKNNMIYRDLKVENIMLNDVFETKVVDFGLIKMTEMLNTGFSFVKDSLTKGVGTFDYMSPEMLNEDDYDKSTDVYSYGVLLYYIFVGSIPKLKLKDKLTGKSIQMPKESDSISQFCIDLIQKCLSFEPISRPTFKQILVDMENHSFKLASNVDSEVIKRRFKELEQFEKSSASKKTDK